MVDSTAAYERGPDSPSFSFVSGDRATSDLPMRSPVPGSDGIDGAGAEHASALLQMGAVKQDAGAYLEAEDLFRRALEIGERALGAENPALVPAMTSLASALIMAGRFEEAAPLVHRALAVSENGPAQQDPDLAIVLNELARLCLKQSAHELAEPLLLRMFALKRAKGEDHPEVATVLASLATVRQALGRHEAAEQLWRRVLEIRERTLAPNHFALATSLEHLGEACAARGKIGEALLLLQRAQTIRELTLGAGHQSVRVARDRIADLQLQAEGSLDSEVMLQAPAPERYRLLSADHGSVNSPPPAPARERPAPPPRKGTTHVIVTPPPRPIEMEVAKAQTAAAAPPPSLAEVAVPSAKPAEHAEPAELAAPVHYRDVIMSIRQELEEDEEGWTATPRAAAIIASVVAAVKQRQKATAIGVAAIAFLVVLASVSSAWSESAVVPPADGTAAPSGSSPTARTPTGGPSASVAKIAEITPAVAAAAATPVPRDRDVEQRTPAKRSTDRRVTEAAPISIPKLPTILAGNFDSVVRARTGHTRPLTESAPTQPLAVTSSGQPLFAREDGATAPQRAQLIGALPTPRYPAQLNDAEGEVRVRFQVDSLGRPVTSTISVVRSSNALFTAATLKVIPDLRFVPARSGGSESRPVSDVVQIGFQFRPSN
jgi:TonB family protein